MSSSIKWRHTIFTFLLLFGATGNLRASNFCERFSQYGQSLFGHNNTEHPEPANYGSFLEDEESSADWLPQLKTAALSGVLWINPFLRGYAIQYLLEKCGVEDETTLLVCAWTVVASTAYVTFHTKIKSLYAAIRNERNSQSTDNNSRVRVLTHRLIAAMERLIPARPILSTATMLQLLGFDPSLTTAAGIAVIFWASDNVTYQLFTVNKSLPGPPIDADQAAKQKTAAVCLFSTPLIFMKMVFYTLHGINYIAPEWSPEIKSCIAVLAGSSTAFIIGSAKMQALLRRFSQEPSSQQNEILHRTQLQAHRIVAPFYLAGNCMNDAAAVVGTLEICGYNPEQSTGPLLLGLFLALPNAVAERIFTIGHMENACFAPQ